MVLDPLDLLEAVSEARIANPQLRASVLAALRLAASSGAIGAGRLFVLRADGSVQEIIAHGQAAQDEEVDVILCEQVRATRAPLLRDAVTALPLIAERRVLGVVIFERLADQRIGQLLASLFLQWCAAAEAMQREKEELLDENLHLREEIRLQYNERDIVAVSGSFRRVIEQAIRAAASTATVLIEGETGTGKELIARLVHEHSPRANRPFVPVNCGALAESLLESELFGHVRGAFTGAVSDRKGRFEAADGGTIFLDEIGEVSAGMQVRLLRVLQEMEIQRVGDTRTRKLDVRVVAATNRRLEDEVKAGRFRADLYYRLNVVYLRIPPLRERPEDIPHLVEHFVGRSCARHVKYIARIAPAVLEAMSRYHWPGNVRELENCVEKMVVLAPGNELTPDLLPFAVVAHEPAAAPAVDGASFEEQLAAWMRAETNAALQHGATDLYDTVRAKWERYLFAAVLEACGDNKSRAAQVLGITRNTLAQRLKELSTVTRQWAVE
ncbi:MAG: sigma-54 dependent transcriptional regulator [Planctomycetota bacterium]|nr:sigma-54 dependent transcriptional regulator [Planctomycetota bacterium]MDW8373824.1 sigma-54 dependent transcriptional regulator [Planctomycetota bacterium]